MQGHDFLSLGTAALWFAAPLLLAAMGELVVERAGVVNIGIEGMMLAGALGAWAADAWWGPAAGLIVAVAAAAALGLIFAVATLLFGADQIVTGTGINLLALGLTGMIARLISHAAESHPVTAVDKRWLVALTLLTSVGVGLFLRRTRAGLELTAIGEAPRAAQTAGVPVVRRQFYAILFGSACAALGGAYMSIMFNRVFTENMIDGRGFLALAIVIFGRWRAAGVVAAGLFFGLVWAIADRLETQAGLSAPTLRLFTVLPYVVSLAALAGVAGKSAAPANLGRAPAD